MQATVELTSKVWTRATAMQEQGAEEKVRGGGVNDIYTRNMQTYHKNTMFQRYGGKLWWKLLIAYGRVTEQMVALIG